MKGFIRNLYLRPSCHNCPCKGLSSMSDITLADYWGVQKTMEKFDDDIGVSLVFINTNKGERLFDELNNLEVRLTSYAEAIRYNPSLEKSAIAHPNRKKFFKSFTKNNTSLISLIDSNSNPINLMRF